MDAKKSRCRRMIELSTQNNDDDNESRSNKPVSIRNSEIAYPLSTLSASDLNIMRSSPLNSNHDQTNNDDDGDFSPASDNDRTYSPSKKKFRRLNSSSSSSSSSSNSSSSSSSSTSSSSDSELSAQQCSNNHQKSDLPTDSNPKVGLARNDGDHVAFSSCANNVAIMHSDTNYTGDINYVPETNDIEGFCPNDAVIEAQAQSVDVFTNKRKKKKTVSINSVKILRNSGKEYVSNSKKKTVFPAKTIKQPCGIACQLKCSDRISEESRKLLFEDYWGMASLMRQREYIARCITEIKPRYQYKKIDSNKKPKSAFYFDINGTTERVCKTFFKNSLAITDRCIRTVVEKMNASTSVLEGEKRGLHGNHRKVPAEMIDEVKKHINSIPRIESHYLRKQTTREYIDGGRTLSDIYSDYKKDCLKQGLPYVQIHTYRKVFNDDFNIGFFVPKKDQCEQCTIYKLADNPQKEVLKEDYDRHLAEKEKSREEKANDKMKVSSNFIVACYDLQAVMTIPNGEVSTFFYKSKINCLNFTISELATHKTECFFWDESQGSRGANEIASCVLKYLQKKSSLANEDLDVVFYSDNCCGQQKNQFIIGMYIYAVLNLKVKSITHKFLIRGHTQNEGDAAHSTIEKQIKRILKSGPIYVPSQYISAIRSAKKRGIPFIVNEMAYNDFWDIKQLPVPKLNKGVEGEVVKLSNIKVIQVVKIEDDKIKIYYKTSYFDDFKELDLGTKRVSTRNQRTPALQQLYKRKLDLPERKKNDVKYLLDTGLIPSFYKSYFDGVLN